MVGGEVLTPLMRTQITKAFSAPVFETYGSHEFNLIARQCKETGELHVCDDCVILEVIKDGRPAEIGERGEVVCTGLHSFAMPFIRYRLGDIVTKGPDVCPCGQPFSTISAVQGRMLDYFPLPGGRMLHPYEIIRGIVSEIVPWVSQYQLIQERVDRITCLVVTSTNPTPSQVAIVEDSATKLLGPGVEFRIVLVSEIKFESNGKFRVARSMVKSDYDGIDWSHREKASP
jgi:phenylacetate-CoA ligase